jgi:hypothetical protein
MRTNKSLEMPNTQENFNPNEGARNTQNSILIQNVDLWNVLLISFRRVKYEKVSLRTKRSNNKTL